MNSSNQSFYCCDFEISDRNTFEHHYFFYHFNGQRTKSDFTCPLCSKRVSYYKSLPHHFQTYHYELVQNIFHRDKRSVQLNDECDSTSQLESDQQVLNDSGSETHILKENKSESNKSSVNSSLISRKPPASKFSKIIRKNIIIDKVAQTKAVSFPLHRLIVPTVGEKICVTDDFKQNFLKQVMMKIMDVQTSVTINDCRQIMPIVCHANPMLWSKDQRIDPSGTELLAQKLSNLMRNN